MSEVCIHAEWICLYIEDMTWLIRLIIPLILTVMLFVYNQVKDIGISNLKKQGIRSKSFWFYFIISILITFWVIILKYNLFFEFGDEDSYLLKNRGFLVGLNLFEAILLIISILWIYATINILNKLFSYINTNKISKSNNKIFIKNSKYILWLVKHWNNKFLPEFISKYLIRFYFTKIIESIEKEYQLFIYKINNRLLTEYENSFNTYNESIINFTKKINKDYLNVMVSKHSENYLKFYKTILKYNILLLRNLNSNETLANTKDIITNIRGLSINAADDIGEESTYVKEELNKYIREYYKTLYEVVNTLSSKSHNYTSTVLSILETQESSSGTDELYEDSDFLTFLVALLYNGIDKNDIKLVTEVTNFILNLSDAFSSLESELENNISEAFSFSEEKDSISLAEISKENVNSNLSNLNNAITLILILSVIKSIEFGSYGCAGFINKMLVRRLPLSIIRQELDSINRNFENIPQINKLNLSDDYFNEEMIKDLDINFNFSRISFEYCFRKGVYLIYKQQNFLIDSNLYSNQDQTRFTIDEYISDRNELNYIKSKIENLDREYGMISLKEKKIEKNIHLSLFNL